METHSPARNQDSSWLPRYARTRVHTHVNPRVPVLIHSSAVVRFARDSSLVRESWCESAERVKEREEKARGDDAEGEKERNKKPWRGTGTGRERETERGKAEDYDARVFEAWIHVCSRSTLHRGQSRCWTGNPYQFERLTVVRLKARYTLPPVYTNATYTTLRELLYARAFTYASIVRRASETRYSASTPCPFTRRFTLLSFEVNRSARKSPSSISL